MTEDILMKQQAQIVDLLRRLEKLETLEGGGGYAANAYWGINQVMNYPSLEVADGAQPEWWEVEDANITLTEEDATGEAITQIYERVLKGVGGAGGADKYIYQRYVHADQYLWDDSVTVISAGAWVWVVTAGTLTMELYDNGGAASLGTATTTTTGSWVRLEITGVTIGTTSTDLRFSHSAASATFYVAMPMINMGAGVRPWSQRGLRYRPVCNIPIAGVDPGGAGWTNVDVTAPTSNLTAMVMIIIWYYNNTSVRSIWIRQNGDAATNTCQRAIRNVAVSTNIILNTHITLVDDTQIFQYYSDAPAGDAENLTIAVRGAWEWE